VAALRISSARSTPGRRAWLLVTLVSNLGILGFFKYFNFFVDSAAAALSAIGIEPGRRTLEIILPVGISFYTFQSLSYTIDVYRRQIPPCRRILDFALFVAFFPQLVAGPIVRAREFLPQLETPRRLAAVRVRPLCMLFLVGFFKKACIADNLAPFADSYYQDPAAYTAASAWLAIILFSIQIYGDFSGYSDMAVALAGLLGYHLPENFRRPYLSPNIAELWRRWHITLSTWLRDYLFVPLGGFRRRSRLATARNLLITFLLGGLWHGAAWKFVIWGGLHGIALGLYAFGRGARRSRRGPGAPSIAAVLGPVVTYLWWLLAGVFFRAASVPHALLVLQALVTLRSPGALELPSFLWAVVAGLAVAEVVAARGWGAGWWAPLPAPVFAVALGALMALAVSLMATVYQPFIYFQF
jgi:alginate O-acetyltransferase complex protein AlgI